MLLNVLISMFGNKMYSMDLAIRRDLFAAGFIMIENFVGVVLFTLNLFTL